MQRPVRLDLTRNLATQPPVHRCQGVIGQSSAEPPAHAQSAPVGIGKPQSDPTKLPTQKADIETRIVRDEQTLPDE